MIHPKSNIPGRKVKRNGKKMEHKRRIETSCTSSNIKNHRNGNTPKKPPTKDQRLRSDQT